MEVLNLLEKVDDLETRGKALLLFNEEAYSFEDLLEDPIWSAGNRVLKRVSEMKLPANYRRAVNFHLPPAK